MATLALFIALGGGSYAAVKLSANSIGSREISRNAVKGAEIAKSAVGSAEIRNGSLEPLDFARLPTGPRGERGTTGPKGVRGLPGDAGPIGPAGAGAGNLRVRLSAQVVDVAAGAVATVHAPCASGEGAVGGGVSYQAPEDAGFARLTGSYPDPKTAGDIPTSWTVAVHNLATNSKTIQFQGYAVCVAP